MKIRILNLLLLVLFASWSFYSCKKTSSQIQRDEEVTHLQAYVKKYLPDIKPTSSGLYFQKIKDGATTKDTIKNGDIVKVYYSGYLIQTTDSIGDGNFFDGTGDYHLQTGNYEPFTFTVGSTSVISGWNEAIKLMVEGEREVARWVLPSRLAYSSQAQSGIPAYSPLLFYVTLVKVYHLSNDSTLFIPPVVSKQPHNSAVK